MSRRKSSDSDLPKNLLQVSKGPVLEVVETKDDEQAKKLEKVPTPLKSGQIVYTPWGYGEIVYQKEGMARVKLDWAYMGIACSEIVVERSFDVVKFSGAAFKSSNSKTNAPRKKDRGLKAVRGGPKKYPPNFIRKFIRDLNGGESLENSSLPAGLQEALIEKLLSDDNDEGIQIKGMLKEMIASEKPPERSEPVKPKKPWSCAVCTFLNFNNNNQCEMCSSGKTAQPPKAESEKDVEIRARAKVIQVLTGDTISIIEIKEEDDDEEEEEQDLLLNEPRPFTIVCIKAPLLREPGKPKQVDEPYAWASRDYLRELLIGKKVYITYFKNKPDKGHVFLEGNEVSLMVLNAGWAKPDLNSQVSNVIPYTRANEEARKNKNGIYDKCPAIKRTFREAGTYCLPKSPEEFQEKGESISILVEEIVHGDVLRGYAAFPGPKAPDAEFQYITFRLAGINCPRASPSVVYTTVAVEDGWKTLRTGLKDEKSLVLAVSGLATFALTETEILPAGSGGLGDVPPKGVGISLAPFYIGPCPKVVKKPENNNQETESRSYATVGFSIFWIEWTGNSYRFGLGRNVGSETLGECPKGDGDMIYDVLSVYGNVNVLTNFLEFVVDSRNETTKDAIIEFQVDKAAEKPKEKPVDDKPKTGLPESNKTENAQSTVLSNNQAVLPTGNNLVDVKEDEPLLRDDIKVEADSKEEPVETAEEVADEKEQKLGSPESPEDMRFESKREDEREQKILEQEDYGSYDEEDDEDFTDEEYAIRQLLALKARALTATLVLGRKLTIIPKLVTSLPGGANGLAVVIEDGEDLPQVLLNRGFAELVEDMEVLEQLEPDMLEIFQEAMGVAMSKSAGIWAEQGAKPPINCEFVELTDDPLDLSTYEATISEEVAVSLSPKKPAAGSSLLRCGEIPSFILPVSTTRLSTLPVVDPNVDAKTGSSGTEIQDRLTHLEQRIARVKSSVPEEHPTSSESSTWASPSQQPGSEPAPNSETISTDSSKAKSKPQDLDQPPREGSAPQKAVSEPVPDGKPSDKGYIVMKPSQPADEKCQPPAGSEDEKEVAEKKVPAQIDKEPELVVKPATVSNPSDGKDAAKVVPWLKTLSNDKKKWDPAWTVQNAKPSSASPPVPEESLGRYGWYFRDGVFKGLKIGTKVVCTNTRFIGHTGSVIDISGNEKPIITYIFPSYHNTKPEKYTVEESINRWGLAVIPNSYNTKKRMSPQEAKSWLKNDAIVPKKPIVPPISTFLEKKVKCSDPIKTLVNAVASKALIDPQHVYLLHKGRRLNPALTFAEARVTEPKLLFVYNYKSQMKFDPKKKSDAIDLLDGDRVAVMRITTEEGCSSETGWGVVRSTSPITYGVRTCDVHIVQSFQSFIFIGICEEDVNLNESLGSGEGYGYYLLDRSIWHKNNRLCDFGRETIQSGDVISVTVELTHRSEYGSISFALNGRELTTLCKKVKVGTPKYVAVGLYSQGDSVSIKPVLYSQGEVGSIKHLAKR